MATTAPAVVVCWFQSDLAASVSLLFTLPTLVSFVISALGWVTHEIIFVMYGAFLIFMHLFLLCVNAGITHGYMFPDPLCPEHKIDGFPSQAAFYVASIATLVFVYSFFQWRFPGYIPFFFIIFIAGAIPATLVWFGYNSAFDVGLSMILGVVFTWIFFVVVWIYVVPNMHRLLNQRPFSIMGYGVGEFVFCFLHVTNKTCLHFN